MVKKKAKSKKQTEINVLKSLKKDLIARANLKKLKVKDLKDLGNVAIKEMKKRISKGISPITGKRFPAYKNPKRYPGKRKPARPVNLKLTGKFLKEIIIKPITGKIPKLIIRFKSDYGDTLEDGHRKGANEQRKRPIFPNRNETLSRGIVRIIEKLLLKILKKRFK